MRKNDRLYLAMTALLIWMTAACGGDENFAPTACGALADTEVFIGETEIVALCFNDPEGDLLTAAASALDPAIVEVVVQGGARALSLQGKSVGETVVDIRASDPSGNMAAASLVVTVPNRGPEVSELPSIILTDENPSFDLLLSDYFTDPDDHDLVYTAEIDDPSVATVSVNDDILTIAVAGNGSATVQVTASDGHGGEASGQSSVSIRVETRLIRDDFDGETIDGHVWERSSTAEIDLVEGRLVLTSSTHDDFAVIETSAGPAVNFKVSANVEAATDDMYPTLLWTTGSTSNVQIIAVIIGGDFRRMASDPSTGRPSNMVAAYCCNDNGSWGTFGEWIGTFDSVKGPGNRMNVTAHVTAAELIIMIDDEVTLRTPRGVANIVVPETIAIVAAGAFPPFDLEGLSGDEDVYFDFIEVRGVPVATANSPVLRLPPLTKLEVHR